MIKLEIRDKDGKKKIIKQNWVTTRQLLDGIALMDEKFTDRIDYINAVAEFMAKILDVSVDELLDGIAAWDWNNKEADFWSQLLGGTDPEVVAEEEN
ncbi:phage tail assembly chaperone G [Ligilactobacillus agilis]|uniref:phage tail assembly chaperone G n=1 Tax=Ligilactobacillus agilis TaxID=1601 RepID=UPI001867A544|nr:hypothetical protein [Ligilactobacillus agilis]